ncbi:MAG: AI-2E family transporter [Bacilli bacterium]|nr:AI-2E family transporter [Bacilli bacterium]
MKENKLNYKLLNIVLIFIICFLFYNTLGLWKFVIDKLIAILAPFLIAFAIAYALYPFLVKLRNKKIPKPIAIILILICVLGFISLIIAILIPIIAEQLSSLFNLILSFISDMSTKYNVDLNIIKENIIDINGLITSFGKSISDFSLSFISKTTNILSKGIICFITSIYFLADMDNIRTKLKRILKRKNKRTYNYLKRIDTEVSNYFVGLEKFIIIQFFEYTIIFFLIGHPYYLLLGILCAITTIIPYFGGIISNIIACVTAFFISKKLFIATLIVALVCPNIDGYIISPRVYGKTNNIPALVSIFSVFAGGIIYGIAGIVIALPVAIILIATYRFYEEDINDKLDDIKEKSNIIEK